jgi:hypothetical protein
MAIRRWISTSDTSFNTTANWSGGTVPVTGDTIIFDGTGTANLTSNLGQSALTGITLIITHANASQIGTDTAGVATYLQIGASSVTIGRNDGGIGTGSQLILLDFGSTTNATNVLQTSSGSANTKYPAVCLLGSAMTLTISGGNVGVAVRPGETATCASLKTTAGLLGSTPAVYAGSGATLTTFVLDSGSLQSFSTATVTTGRTSGGRYVYEGTGAHTTLEVDDGTVIYNGTGTITTADVRGELDFSHDSRAKTVTTANVYKGGTLNVDNGVPGGIVFTNPINYPDGLDKVQVRTPAGVKGTLTNI